MSALSAVREELLAGDLRALFVSWLGSVWAGGEVEGDGDEEEHEEMETTPPVPPGLARLTHAQQELAAFLRVDQDLLDAAAEASPALRPTGTAVGDWIKALSVDEKDRMLLDLAEGNEPRLGAKLVRRFRSETAGPASDGPALPLRKLLDRARALRDERKNKMRAAAERERQKREAAKAAEREAHLEQLMEEEEKAWGQVEEILRLKQNKFYDDAVKTLRDLREVAVRKSALDAFVSRLRRLREAHKAKYTFVEKLDKATRRWAPIER